MAKETSTVWMVAIIRQQKISSVGEWKRKGKKKKEPQVQQ
jgi:hypothetical protein